MSFNFKNRIAFYYMIATAVIMAIVFGFVYLLVKSTVYRNLDGDLSYEAGKHFNEITFRGDSLWFMNKAEWAEKEHREIQVNPVFIQLIDNEGKIMDKSPNLKDDLLPVLQQSPGTHMDASIDGRPIRQVQLPVNHAGKVRGYILAAISSESAQSILLKLRNVLGVSFLVVLAGLYFISRFLAGRSIAPVKEISQTTNRITRNNLNERVNLPRNKDELYDLAYDFNNLLQRIEDTLKRERQFTSDASHELRTPLASLRGTLEVLVRKPRSAREYEEKIQYSLAEIDRMSATVEQLLLLARLDSHPGDHNGHLVSLQELIEGIASRYAKVMEEKKISFSYHPGPGSDLLIPEYYGNLILDNLISNAIKYSRTDSTLSVFTEKTDKGLLCRVQDEGIGIKTEDLEHIFESFYRSEALEHKHISGNGLGLSIARKSAEAIDAFLEVTSKPDQGSTFSVTFPNHQVS